MGERERHTGLNLWRRRMPSRPSSVSRHYEVTNTCDTYESRIRHKPPTSLSIMLCFICINTSEREETLQILSEFSMDDRRHRRRVSNKKLEAAALPSCAPKNQYDSAGNFIVRSK